MTPNEAIDYIENEIRCVQRARYCDRDCAKCKLAKEDKPLIKAFGEAIKALEMQISKRPHNIKTAPSDCYISYGDCPCCNADVFEYQHYCIDCGQKIDWGDKE